MDTPDWGARFWEVGRTAEESADDDLLLNLRSPRDYVRPPLLRSFALLP